MDAASKRFLWSVIKRRTASCCTILTTHSMEECEALCSRIGVMVDGTMRCLGAIQSLKTQYGQGFKLDVRLDAAAAPAAVVRFLQEACPGASLEEAQPPCLTLTLPQRDDAGADLSLAHVFRKLDEHLPWHGISVVAVGSRR